MTRDTRTESLATSPLPKLSRVSRCRSAAWLVTLRRALEATLLTVTLIGCKSNNANKRADVQSQPAMTPVPPSPADDDEPSEVSPRSDVASAPRIDLDLLKKADSTLAFLKTWNGVLRYYKPEAPVPRGYDRPDAAPLYDRDSFKYIRHDDSEVVHGRWPVTKFFPELGGIISHEIYSTQFAKNAPFTEEATLVLTFVEDVALIAPFPNTHSDINRGEKTITLRPDGESYKIVAEEEFKREKAPPSVPKPQRLDLRVPGAAQYIVVAERPCASIERGRCVIPGVFLLVQGTEGKLLFHMTQVSSDLAPGAFVDDPDHFYLESLYERTYYGFSFTRERDILAVDAGWSDAEVRQRIREWSPIARIALGSKAPIPLWCLPLHHSEPKAKPCFEKKPTL